MAQAAAERLSVFPHPIYSILLAVPIVCFAGGLVTDLVYSSSDGNLLWLDFSSWLIAAGLVFGGVAGLALIIELIRSVRLRRAVGPSASLLLLLAAWIVELINSFVHARDGWTAVVPLGLVLSIAGVVLILISGWAWQSIHHREGEAP
jgi:uncharacterized membrane protein